jgi:predicted nucleotidyltransferase
VVFGSAAAPEEKGPMSDLDIAVEFAEVPSPAERLEVVRELQALVDPLRVDVVFLRRELDPVLRFEVFRSGQPLHEAEEGLMVRERVRALKEYQDALPFRRLLIDHLNRMAREGTLVP